MKRILAVLAPAALAACSGTGTLNLSLTSDAMSTTSSTTTPPASLDDATVKSITLTITEVDVHLADKGAPDDNNPPDDDGGWQTLNLVDTDGGPVKTVDIVVIRDAPTSLGTIQLPTGKITQIRLKVQTDGASIAEPGFDTITGAVQIAPVPPSTDPTFCDLAVPHSAVNPGVKINAPFKSITITDGGAVSVLLDFKLNEMPPAASGSSSCLYKLAPVLQIEKVDTR